MPVSFFKVLTNAVARAHPHVTVDVVRPENGKIGQVHFLAADGAKLALNIAVFKDRTGHDFVLNYRTPNADGTLKYHDLGIWSQNIDGLIAAVIAWLNDHAVAAEPNLA